MKAYKNLILIGTSHIAKQSLDAVNSIIEKENPDIIGIELDKRRATALLSEKQRGIRLRDIRRVGLKGYFFALLGGWAEKKMGELVGTKPGAEMKAAIIIAKKKKKRISFIDQDIEITLRKLSKRISWKERWNFFADIIQAVFSGKKRKLEFDLRTVPEEKVIKKLIKKVKKRYPNVYDVLIKERDEVMAKNLAKLMVRFPDKKIVAFVGAGHEKEILGLVKKYLEMGVIYSFTVS